jgi:hypothetical protein
MSEDADRWHSTVLGEMVVAAGALEAVVYDIARCLGVQEPETASVRKGAKRASRQVREELPPWARTEPQALNRWLENCPQLLDRRNRLIHSARHRVFRGGAWVPALRDIRSGEVLNQSSAEEIQTLVNDLFEAHATGMLLQLGLMHLLADGVHAWHPPFRRLYTPKFMRAPRLYPADPLPPPRDAQEQYEEYDSRLAELLKNAPRSWLAWPSS